MTQAGNQRRDYVYDDDGSRAQDLIAQQAFAERAYFYDALGRTSGLMIYHGFNEVMQPQIFDDPNGCKYDALGRQIKACAGTAPFVSLDGANLIRAEQWRIRHGPGLDDPLISRVPTGTSGARELYHVTDGAGRHYARAEASGSVHPDIPVASAYLGWEATGVTEEANGYAADRLERPSAPGLSFFRNRVYDQETGRWTQEDPIGVAGGINLYQFNGNDPVTFRDPYGLCIPWPQCALAAAGAGARAGTIVGGAVGTLVATPGPGTISGAAIGRGVGAVVGFGVASYAAYAIWKSSRETKEIKALIGQVTGEVASDEAYDAVSKEVHDRKARGEGGTKNKKGDFTKGELRELIEDVLGSGSE